jgi:hypothetical protein
MNALKSLRHFRRAAIIVGAVVILATVFSYGLLAGKYQYPPYGQVSPIYQRFYDFKQYFVNQSPLFSEEAIEAEEKTLKEKEKNLQLVSAVSESVTDTILAAYRPYEVPLDSPIGYIIGYSVRSGDSVPVYIHNTETTSVDIYRLGRMRSKVESLETLDPNPQSPSFSPYRALIGSRPSPWKPAGIDPGITWLN